MRHWAIIPFLTDLDSTGRRNIPRTSHRGTPGRSGRYFVADETGEWQADCLHKQIGRQDGALWGGCFKARPIQREDYLLACIRYVELNPLRAGMVAGAYNNIRPPVRP